MVDKGGNTDRAQPYDGSIDEILRRCYVFWAENGNRREVYNEKAFLSRWFDGVVAWLCRDKKSSRPDLGGKACDCDLWRACISDACENK